MWPSASTSSGTPTPMPLTARLSTSETAMMPATMTATSSRTAAAPRSGRVGDDLTVADLAILRIDGGGGNLRAADVDANDPLPGPAWDAHPYGSSARYSGATPKRSEAGALPML